MNTFASVLVLLIVSIVTLIGVLRIWGHDMLRTERHGVILAWIALTLASLVVIINV